MEKRERSSDKILPQCEAAIPHHRPQKATLRHARSAGLERRFGESVSCAHGCEVLLANRALVLVQWRDGLDLHAEDVLFDVMRERLELVRGVYVRRHGEH